MNSLKISLAQINPLVGDIPGNVERMLRAVKALYAQEAPDVIVFPELCLTGYPPEDLLLRPSLGLRVEPALAELCAANSALCPDTAWILGYPGASARGLHNKACVIYRGAIQADYAKQQLPNYQVFDERRYFIPGDSPCVLAFKGIAIGLLICEDLWFPEPIQALKVAGAQLIVSLNASPFHLGKGLEREQLLSQRARETGLPILYVNQVGGQDELVFDGASLAVSAAGDVLYRAAAFTQDSGTLAIEYDARLCRLLPQTLSPTLSDDEALYRALVLAVRDYVEKNRFPGVLLGLSGGIDSALTLAIAVDALGADRVTAVMMPYHYTSPLSLEAASAQAQTLGVTYLNLAIAPMVEAFNDSLSPHFVGLAKDATEENLQARCRGVLLMALSNKTGRLVLTTGNKSEMAVGYATLYGDMAGGFDVLKDVLKTRVFALARYRNTLSAAIPPVVIDRPPSAELAPNQCDQDSLPPYEVLDAILTRYIEGDWSQAALIAEGFEAETVERVLKAVDRNEYKRRQAAIGPRLSPRGFGRDRRYPITQGWQPGL
jgi:NAD+ synthase (glutamine-hydrolysing)